MGSQLSMVRLIFDPNVSGQQYCNNFRRLAFAYVLLSSIMIYLAYSTYTNFKLADHQFAVRIAIISGLQAVSYLLKSLTLYPLGKYNDILTITHAQILIASLFSTLAFLLLIIRYGYEMIYFNSLRAKFSDYDDSINVNAAAHMRTQIIVLAFSFIIITVFNGILLIYQSTNNLLIIQYTIITIILGATLVTLFQFYKRLEKFKTDANNALHSPTFSINPVNVNSSSRIP